VLALIVWQRPNLLLLDEPTNHLDLDMRQALTEALIEFEGAGGGFARSSPDPLHHRRSLLGARRQSRTVRRRSGRLSAVADDVQKQENQPEESAKDNANSAQARKDQKRRRSCTQTQPLRKEIARLEKEMEKLNATLATVEEKLGDSGLYDQSRKAELTDCLQTQAKTKSSLEECEMAWLDAQEQLEAMLQAD
jgi:ATP-binding cassette subfamily F protein 3